ncbi:MAG: MBL fold metallo-hydrolase, partial [Desulfobacterales bacterium]
MSLTITWYSHACFLIETDKARLLVDPFITDNPLSPVKADEMQVNFILVSHGHGDHVGDTVSIAKQTGAMVISNYEIQNWIVSQGVENVHPLH